MLEFGRHQGTRWTCLGGACLLALIGIIGCASGGSPYTLFGSPYPVVNGRTGGTTGPGSSGSTGGTGVGGGTDRTPVDPCTLAQSRKFVRMSLRNTDADDYIHYFLVFIAFVSDDANVGGAVCADDIALYTSFGYTEIAAGQQREFGTYCIPGRSLVYFHRGGQFRAAGGSGGSLLASAIAPAQGTQATFDNFFTSAGAVVPVPDLVLFYNPGTGEGAALKISRNAIDPCGQQPTGGSPDCQQDAFYYVDEQDLMTGSTALGTGSGRRVPTEIQGTGCECTGFAQAFATLAPAGISGANANCNEFLRGGRLDFAFVRLDTNPPFPQLVWRVTDASGAVVHSFDPRAGIP